MFSGAGNIAAATGLVKKEEFPADLKVSYPLDIHTCTYAHTHVPGTPINALPIKALSPSPPQPA